LDRVVVTEHPLTDGANRSSEAAVRLADARLAVVMIGNTSAGITGLTVVPVKAT